MDEYLTYIPNSYSLGYKATNKLYILDEYGIYEYNGNHYSMPTSVNVPEFIKEIPDYLFAGFKQIDTVTFSDTLEDIGEYAFANTSIKSLEIPGSVKETGYASFEFCTKLTSVTLNEGLEVISGQSFMSCDINSINIPSTVKKIESNAFSSNSIGGNLIIPDSVEVIAPGAFMINDIAGIKIGSGLNELGNQAFSILTKLETIEVDSKNTVFYSSSNALIQKEDKMMVVSSMDATIPSDVLILGESLFAGLETKSITIPKTVTKISKGVFFLCSNLEAIYYEGTKEEFSNITLQDDWNTGLDLKYIICSDENYII